MHKRVMVVGGGIAGVEAALQLADMGIEVYLVESSPSIGGRMAQLDKTFPTNDCSMCILSPKLVEAGGHPYIRIISNADVKGISGEAPNFHVSVSKRARFVNEERCTGCGVCTSKCPARIADDYNKNLNQTRCIHMPFPQAIPAVPIIEKDFCIYFKTGKCQACKKFCESGAIDFEQKDELLEFEVGSVVLASGAVEFDALGKGEYGYKTFPNVVTSIELERILSASGPTQGHVKRSSDRKEPRRIAFIQCVGSRDMQAGALYCSAFCCMQAAKDSIIIKEHSPYTESTVFFMDIRTYGKDYDRFIERAKKEYGTRFVRARVGEITSDPPGGDLFVRYTGDDGRTQREKFDMVVLSVGLKPSKANSELAERLGIDLDECGFCSVGGFAPVSTSRPGIFVAGTLCGPKDIPESVMEACGAASAAALAVVEKPKKEIKVAYPPERDVSGEPLRIGAFICRCGINIAATVDVPDAVKYTSGLPGVVYAQELLFACSQDSQKVISEKIAELGLNRVIVASCTPRTHEPLFQNTLKKSGLNPYLFEFVNIREQCSWVHQKEPRSATSKAKDLIRMAALKTRLLEPLTKTTLKVTKKALVIGGGVAGMTAALDIARAGFDVHLVEKDNELGGNLRGVRSTLAGGDTKKLRESLVKSIASDKKIAVHKEAKVVDVSGYIGNFRTAIGCDSWEGCGRRQVEIEHGVVVVATGANELQTGEFLHGRHKKVISQIDLESRLNDGKSETFLAGISSVAMIQCVGSRNSERPYCSRVCCSQAVKNALKLKDIKPEANVYVLYRDMRTYGLDEIYYTRAREKGVIFIRYDEDKMPVVKANNGRLHVETFDYVLNRAVAIRPDLLVLSLGISPPEDNKVLSKMLKVPLNQDGFFLEAHVKLRPMDFATDGIFVCGMAHYPKTVKETIAQARAAAARAAAVLSKDEIEGEGKVSTVIKERCNGCGLCVEVCPYKAIELDSREKVAVVNTTLCKGCGVCAASCRPGAMDLQGFKNDQILAQLEALVQQ